METPYQPITSEFRQQIDVLIDRKKYVGILYFSPLHELLSTTSIIKEISTLEGMPFMRLVTGEEIRLDQIINIDGIPAPGYDIEDFTCDC